MFELEEGCLRMFVLGAMLPISVISKIPISCIFSDVNAVTAIGVSCSMVSRLWAVTTTSSRTLLRSWAATTLGSDEAAIMASARGVSAVLRDMVELLLFS